MNTSHYISRLALELILLLNVSASNAFACPVKSGIADYNCDGKVVIFFIGDSLVYGYGDTEHNNKGGYVLQLKKSLKNVTVGSYGIQGLRTQTLISTINDTFKDDLYPTLRKSLNDADIIILDLGRNDRWLFGLPSQTYRNLARITTLLSRGVTKDTGYSPLVVKAVLMLPNRGNQGPWVKELNEIILAKSTNALPSDLRFDLVSKRLIGFDQIHPTTLGYKAIARAFKSYIPDLKDHVEINQPDSDADNIPDLYETKKFLTNPLSADTDGDTKSDAAEIFTLGTDALVVD